MTSGESDLDTCGDIRMWRGRSFKTLNVPLDSLKPVLPSSTNLGTVGYLPESEIPSFFHSSSSAPLAACVNRIGINNSAAYFIYFAPTLEPGGVKGEHNSIRNTLETVTGFPGHRANLADT